MPIRAAWSALRVFGRGTNGRDALASLLAASYAASEALLCGSGTQALQIAIEIARTKVGHDSIVALPAFSCFDVASAAVGAGGPVTLYDLDPRTLSPDLLSLQRALDRGARIVVVAPLYGLPVDWDAVAPLALASGAILIEDAAQGHGAEYRGEPLGTLGDISTMSFGRGKGWTGGSGGAVLLRRGIHSSEALEATTRTRALSSGLALVAQWALGRPALYGLPRSAPGLSLGETVYHEPRRPESMSESAAVAILQSREAATREVEVRRANARWLRDRVGEQPLLMEVTSPAPDSTPGYLRFPVLGRSGVLGFGVGAARLGIAPSYPRPLGDLVSLAPNVVGERQFPGAEQLTRELITLPVHSLLTDRDRSMLADRIRSYSTAPMPDPKLV